MSPTRLTVALCAFCSIGGAHRAAAALQADLASPNVETLPLKSGIFHNTRTLRVLLPPGYHEASHRERLYPVLYLNDGIMAFRPAAIHVEEAVHGLIASGLIPPMIVVGIDNGGSTEESTHPETDRANEFLPYPDVGFAPRHIYAGDPPNPQGRLYPRFLLEEVMPQVERRYRVAHGPAHTGIGGFSYGGVAALHAALSHPEVFGVLLLESTPLWIGPDLALLKDIRTAREWPAKVSIGVGTAETDDPEINQEGRRELGVLRASITAASPRTRLEVVVEEGAGHEPSAWRRRLPKALQFLYGGEGR